MASELLESPMDEIYRIRQEISAQYDHNLYRLYCAVLNDQRARARQGQIYWGYNAAGELAPIPTARAGSHV